MDHLKHGNGTSSAAILVKRSAHTPQAIKDNYITPLTEMGVDTAGMVSIPLAYDNPKKVSAVTKKAFLDDLLGYLQMWGVTTLYVADAEYFKTLLKVTKTEDSLGYVKKGVYPGYEEIDIVLGINYQASIYNPTADSKLKRSLQTLTNHVGGSFEEPGKNIIKKALYPSTYEEIKTALRYVATKPSLTVDIEGRSLKFWQCGLESITFCWNQHEGIAFVIDRHQASSKLKKLLRTFFSQYTGNLKYHNAGFDLKVLVYELFMKNLIDYKGMNHGIKVLTRNVDDTKLIAYLALNSTSEVPLGLKALSAEYTGVYALDGDEIKDTSKVETSKLLQYNLIDGLGTWYVYTKYYPRMVEDMQEPVYTGMMLPSMETLLQTELVGMPINPTEVQAAKTELQSIVSVHISSILAHPYIKEFWYGYLGEMANKDNAKRLEKSKTKKIKIKTADDFLDQEFNPGSSTQLQSLLYKYMKLPVIDHTKTKQPATGAKTLDKLINHCKTEQDQQLMRDLIGLAKAQKILSSFIPAFEQAVRMPDGTYRLYGNFNLGGTQSGRLSSSDPNLQNIPSGSRYAKIIKRCFVSIPGWIFCGADYNALEARIGALLPKDPEKLKVYTDGYDSHCLNAYTYFSNQMPDVKAAFETATTKEERVAAINSIKKLYPKLRTKSKAPTFALQYFGTYYTIMNSAGLSETESRGIEFNYHQTFALSIRWINKVLDKAHEDGYITLAFGLRLRTPALKKTILGTKMPYAATAERRSAGNAKSQSYGLLNSRSANEFRDRTLASEYAESVLPCAQIHDAAYYMAKDDPKVVKWVNDNLVECMQWQELPEIQHDEVKMGGNLDLFWPSWEKALELPNHASIEEIKTLCKDHYEQLKLAA